MPQVAEPASPEGFHLITYRVAGIRLSAPRSWIASPQSPPLITEISSGGAVISLWRYARSGAPPITRRQLQRDSRRLIAAALLRQPNLHVISTTPGQVDGHPSIELDATERVGSARRRVRSIHVFGRAAELVLEEYAAPAQFDRVDRLVFDPVRRSLVLLAP